MLDSKLGLPPWDVFHQGIAKHTPLTFGIAVIVVGVFVLGAAFFLGVRPGLGTLLNTLLVGTFIQLLTSIDWVNDLMHRPLGFRIGLLALGIVLTAAASAFYIGADMGAGPRDSLMLAGAHRLHLRVGITRASLELSALTGGIVLGGTAGIGTAVYALTIGPMVELGFWGVERVGLAHARPAETLLLPE